MVKCSILTACYNTKPFLKQCAKSILSQNYQNMEWVVVDDSSNDGSYEYLSSIKDDRIKLIRNPQRMFCGSSYNVALQAASGDICGIVDSDDALAANAVEAVVYLYDRQPSIGYIYTQHFWCDVKLRVNKIGVSCLPRLNRSFVDMSLRYNAHCCSHWRTFRRDVSDKAVIFRPGLKYAVDKYLAFTLEEITMGAFYKVPLYYYRYHPNNMSKVCSREQSESCRSLVKEFSKKRKKQRHYPVCTL